MNLYSRLDDFGQRPFELLRGVFTTESHATRGQSTSDKPGPKPSGQELRRRIILETIVCPTRRFARSTGGWRYFRNGCACGAGAPGPSPRTESRTGSRATARGMLVFRTPLRGKVRRKGLRPLLFDPDILHQDLDLS